MLFTKSKRKISVFEAQSIWLVLSTKYRQIEHVQFWTQYVHDIDLKRLLNEFKKDLQEHINLLEKQIEKYSIAEGPPRPRKNIQLDVDTSIISDEFIGVTYLTFMQGMVENILFSVQYSIFSDEVANFISKFSSHVIEQTDSLLRYLKLKGWLDIPPNYHNPHKEFTEKINCFEAFHLWSHTDYRYTNLEETLRWIEFVNDKDFAFLLKSGTKVMEKQISILEAELDKFGIQTSKRPPKFLGGTKDKEIFRDKYIFKTLFTGLQWAGVLHANAFKNSVTNERIRALFKDFLYAELDLVTDAMKYGKIKGWLPVPPLYE